MVGFGSITGSVLDRHVGDSARRKIVCGTARFGRRAPVPSAYEAVLIIGTLLGILSAVGIQYMRNVAGDMQGDMQLAIGDADIAFSGDQLVVQSSPVLIE